MAINIANFNQDFSFETKPLLYFCESFIDMGRWAYWFSWHLRDFFRKWQHIFQHTIRFVCEVTMQQFFFITYKIVTCTFLLRSETQTTGQKMGNNKRIKAIWSNKVLFGFTMSGNRIPISVTVGTCVTWIQWHLEQWCLY